MTISRFAATTLAVAVAALFGASAAVAVAPPTRGTLPEVVAEGFRSGVFPQADPSGTLRAGSEASSQSTWFVPVILVDFTDQALTYAPGNFDLALFDTTAATATGSVYDYYQWVSGGRLRVTGKVVGIVHLRENKAYYANNSWGLSYTSEPRNSYGVVDEAVRWLDPTVDWTPFDQDRDGYVDMLWVVHSGLGGEHTVTRDNLWSITSRMTQWARGQVFVSNDPVPGSMTQKIRIDRFTMLPEISAFKPGQQSEIGVYCHEFGHALGLPDLYDTAASTSSFNVGPGCWSLMSTGGYGADSRSPEYPTHLGAWPALFMGWAETIRPSHDTLLTLPPLARSGRILDLWFQGESSSEHFLIENRQREGFDRNLLQEGLIVYQVDEALIGSRLASNRVNTGPLPGLRVVEADGRFDMQRGQSRGDAQDPFPGATGNTEWDEVTQPSSRSLLGALTYVGMRNITPTGDDMRFLAQVRAPGWQPALDQSLGSYAPVAPSGPAPRAVIHSGGTISAVSSEMIGGRPQVVLRTRGPDRVWRAPIPISATTASALEPTIAALPGDDLAILWADTRHGASELYYRSRVGDVWGAEERLTFLAGSSRQPSVGADRFGGVHVAWLYTDAGAPQVLFMYFPYLSPFGDPRPVTGPLERPDAPALATSRNGSSVMLWVDRLNSPASAWFVRFHPDTGMAKPLKLGTSITFANAAFEPDESLSMLWLAGGGGVSEIHFERRSVLLGAPLPRDTIIERRGGSLLNPRVAVDGQGGIHLITEASAAGNAQVRYKRWHRGVAWDIGSTEVTLVQEGVAARPTVLPVAPGVVTILYSLYDARGAHFMERQRDLDAWSNPTTDVQATVIRPAFELTVSPNPWPGGSPLQIEWAGDAGAKPTVDVFDLAGRRIARVALSWSGERWVGSLPRSAAAWSSGVYWARVGGGSARRFVVMR